MALRCNRYHSSVCPRSDLEVLPHAPLHNALVAADVLDPTAPRGKCSIRFPPDDTQKLPPHDDANDKQQTAHRTVASPMDRPQRRQILDEDEAPTKPCPPSRPPPPWLRSSSTQQKPRPPSGPPPSSADEDPTDPHKKKRSPSAVPLTP